MSAIPDGTPIVLLNAFPVSRVQWDPLLAAWKRRSLPRGDVITFDMPGIGEMPLPEEEPSLELIADAAVPAMREVTVHESAVWIGCSMGGYVAMAVAERHPEAVAGLGLIGTRSGADDEAGVAKRLSLADSLEGAPGASDPRAMAEPLVGGSGDARDAIMTAVAADIARHGGDGIAWGQRAMAARPDRTEVLRGLDVPAVVIRGADDGIVAAPAAQEMADALGVDVATVSGAGHLAAWEAPEEVAQALEPLMRL